MILSFLLTFMSIISLVPSRALDIAPVIVAGSLGVIIFGTLSTLHVVFFALRRVGLLQRKSRRRGCCG